MYCGFWRVDFALESAPESRFTKSEIIAKKFAYFTQTPSFYQTLAQAFIKHCLTCFIASCFASCLARFINLLLTHLLTRFYRPYFASFKDFWDFADFSDSADSANFLASRDYKSF
ncbi:hypothetical protein BKN38_04235 [Helicobacter sp. CLO-3]|nr:hypothetical protein BA723_00890 [Helicobacter sp. CLO-3]OHU84013.1 hypothetical protein BKN38_04235 [Helicobacter sp. CLO-3]